MKKTVPQICNIFLTFSIIFILSVAGMLPQTNITAHATSASGSSLNYSVTGSTKNLSFSQTPVGKHGKLSVASVSNYSAPTIVDESGKAVQLHGASTHGIQWFSQYVNEDAFHSLRDEWGIDTVRLAVYPKEGGYLDGSQASMDATIQKGVEAAKDLGMYIIIDWHVLSYNPNNTIDGAKTFFAKYAAKYKDYDNVIFEICNEPTSTSWYDGSSTDLYTYCKTVSSVIRNAGSDAIILCGTNNWSQSIDEVSKKPLSNDGFTNIMYTLHFYAATHYDSIKNNLKTAVASGTPVFVSEFGICDASGNGGYDIDNANSWISLLTSNNISFCCWALSNKGESASYLKSSCSKTSGWTSSDLATTGIWLVNTCRSLEGNSSSGSSSSSSSSASSSASSSSSSSSSTGKSSSGTGSSSSSSSSSSSTGTTSKSSTSTSGSATVSSTINSDWGNGGSVNIALNNNGSSSISGWTIEFDMNAEINNIWCATIVSHTGNHYVISAAGWNNTISAGSNTNFGFTVTKSASTKLAVTNLTVK